MQWFDLKWIASIGILCGIHNHQTGVFQSLVVLLYYFFLFRSFVRRYVDHIKYERYALHGKSSSKNKHAYHGITTNMHVYTHTRRALKYKMNNGSRTKKAPEKIIIVIYEVKRDVCNFKIQKVHTRDGKKRT